MPAALIVAAVAVILPSDFAVACLSLSLSFPNFLNVQLEDFFPTSTYLLALAEPD
jgi:hypothetical protein